MDGAGGSSSASADLAQTDDSAAKTVMVLAATNRPWDLDEAIRRRLEKRVYIPLPSAVGREALFRLNLKSLALAPDLDFQRLAAKTEGYSGADISCVCREAALLPLRRRILSEDFDWENLDGTRQQGLETDLNNIALTGEDFDEAIGNTQKSVNPDQLEEFTTWMAQFGA
jgi:katanin p60 ATPase-containing subunit A1